MGWTRVLLCSRRPPSRGRGLTPSLTRRDEDRRSYNESSSLEEAIVGRCLSTSTRPDQRFPDPPTTKHARHARSVISACFIIQMTHALRCAVSSSTRYSIDIYRDRELSTPRMRKIMDNIIRVHILYYPW